MHILEGADAEVARWVWSAYKLRPILLDHAIGVLDDDKKLVGAILLSNYNGFNIDYGYYGRGTFSVRLFRWTANLGLRMNISRATILTSKKNKPVINCCVAIRARLEGVSRRYYGDADCPRNTAVRFVLFREQMERFVHGPQNKTTTDVA